MSEGILRERIEALKDEKNAAFLSDLCPQTDPSCILGARVPQLRRLAAQAEKEGLAEAFLRELPHVYHEENIVHAILVSRLRSVPACIEALECFLPWTDNWAVTDTIRPSLIRKHPAAFEPHLQKWMASDHPFTVRTAIGLYMAYYLEEAFRTEQAEAIASLRSENYYVNMMRAWYMATALAKQPEEILPLLKGERMDEWTRKKAIQKALESRRISGEQKEILHHMRKEIA